MTQIAWITHTARNIIVRNNGEAAATLSGGGGDWGGERFMAAQPASSRVRTARVRLTNRPAVCRHADADAPVPAVFY